MTLGGVIGVGAIAVAVLVLVMFPEARVLLKGITRVFIKDMAATPEGAMAIYEEKIDKAQEAYAIADDALKRASGKLSNAKKDLEKKQKKLKEVESQCEALVREGKIDLARVKAEEREEIASDINRIKELINAFGEATEQAKEAYEHCEQHLRKLKKESKEVVENMKVKAQLKEVYEDMDELRASTATDKLLDSVREKNNDLNALVEGAKVVHDSKMSTKLLKADKEAKQLQSTEYLDSLMTKYNKKAIPVNR